MHDFDRTGSEQSTNLHRSAMSPHNDYIGFCRFGTLQDRYVGRSFYHIDTLDESQPVRIINKCRTAHGIDLLFNRGLDAFPGLEMELA